MAKQAKTDAGRDVAEMIDAWTKIEAAAKAQFPHASDEERYQICKNAMLHAMGQR